MLGICINYSIGDSSDIGIGPSSGIGIDPSSSIDAISYSGELHI
jgi:hypothetical protein